MHNCENVGKSREPKYPIARCRYKCRFRARAYLKCLRAVEFGQYFEGHDLKSLYDDLGDDTKREIERRHALCERDLAELAAKQGAAVPTDLDSLLQAGKNAFTDFRYAYEMIPAGTVWGLDALMLIVKHLILEKQPAFQSLQLDQTPSPHARC